MVRTPFAAQAAGGFSHSPGGDEKSKNLPVRGMQIVDIGKAGKTQAGDKGAQREKNGARKGFLAQAIDGEEEMHVCINYRAGVGFAERSAADRFEAALKGLDFSRAENIAI